MISVQFSRWPWQWYLKPEPGREICPEGRRYGWLPNNTLMSRFGGGWGWKLGFAFSGRTLIVDLLFGAVRITFGRQA